MLELASEHCLELVFAQTCIQGSLASVLALAVVRKTELTGPVQDQCAFNGAWGGSRRPTAFYVSSYFWDRATDAEIISDENAITWDLKPGDFINAANKACGSAVSGLGAIFPKVRHTPGELLQSLWVIDGPASPRLATIYNIEECLVVDHDHGHYPKEGECMPP